MTMSASATRFLILSDTHNFEFADETNNSRPFHQPLPKADVVLHCGDLTQCGGVSSYKKALKMLGAIDAELKLVIAGNHDLDLDQQFWDTHLDEGDEPEDHSRAMDVMTGSLAAEAGVTHLKEGVYTFTLKSGARFSLYASPYSPEFCDWAFAYKHDEDRYNEAFQTVDGIRSTATNPIPDFPGVDIVMTHGPPKGILDKVARANVGCPNLLQALRRSRPLMHCFGHIHEGNGVKIVDWESERSNTPKLNGGQVDLEAQGDFVNVYPNRTAPQMIRGYQSLMVNAAIMNVKNEPTNAPWIVDLELPHATSNTREVG